VTGKLAEKEENENENGNKGKERQNSQRKTPEDQSH